MNRTSFQSILLCAGVLLLASALPAGAQGFRAAASKPRASRSCIGTDASIVAIQITITSAKPTAATQKGMAVGRQTTSTAAGMKSKARCAKTVPTNVAQERPKRGMCRVSTATRASSPN